MTSLARELRRSARWHRIGYGMILVGAIGIAGFVLLRSRWVVAFIVSFAVGISLVSRARARLDQARAALPLIRATITSFELLEGSTPATSRTELSLRFEHQGETVSGTHTCVVGPLEARYVDAGTHVFLRYDSQLEWIDIDWKATAENERAIGYRR